MSEIIQHFHTLLENLPVSRDTIACPPRILTDDKMLYGLSARQREVLQRVNDALVEVRLNALNPLSLSSFYPTVFSPKDFTIRRRMVLTRLHVTIRSFLWGEKAAGKEDEILTAIETQRRYLSDRPIIYTVRLRATVSLPLMLSPHKD
jgi:hypothetical protein